jgi:hypothetical protein
MSFEAQRAEIYWSFSLERERVISDLGARPEERGFHRSRKIAF